ncbi:MAG: hypothetical protein K5876_00975 [Ruminiclostridium sp.]|nr:hypothetical protein [Ruminiclostridium sp.]
MNREERFLEMLSGLDDRLIERTMPVRLAPAETYGAGNAAGTSHTDEGAQISKRDLRIYLTVRALGLAAAVVLIVGAAVLFIMNWDKIAIKEPDPPAAVTTTTTSSVTVGTPDTQVTEPAPAEQHDIENLDWGMLEEDISGFVNGDPDSRETAEIGFDRYTLLNYKRGTFMERYADITLYVSESQGLDRLRYKLYDNDLDMLYEELLGRLRELYDGEAAQSSSETIWHDEKYKYTIELISRPDCVIVMFRPLFGESERQAFLDHIIAGGSFDQDGEPVEMIIDTGNNEYSPEGIVCDPIDRGSFDPDDMAFGFGEEMQVMFNDYLRSGGGKAYTRGDPECVEGFPGHLTAYPVDSDDLKTVDDIKERMNSVIYGAYVDHLLFEKYGEANGRLYYLEGTRGGIRATESWYLGCDVYDDRVVGHYALLHWGGEDNDERKAEFLNDIDNYDFYDIVIQRVGGKYVVTDVRGTHSGGRTIDYDYFEHHGIFYNANVVDRTLITNYDVMPYAYRQLKARADEAALEAVKTFEVKNYIAGDLAGMSAGYAYPFGNGLVAGDTAFEPIQSTSLNSCDGFFVIEHNDLPDDLIELLKQYADGNDLKYDLGGELPAQRCYRMFDDTELSENYGYSAYRLNDEYLVTVSSEHHVNCYRKSTGYTDARKAVEKLWKYAAESPEPFDVFAVLENNRDYDPEYLMIVADDKLSAERKKVSVLGEIKELIAEYAEDWGGGFVFMSPEQLRKTWMPVTIVDGDSEHGDLTDFFNDICAYTGMRGDVFTEAPGDELFDTPGEVAAKLDGFGRTKAAQAMRGEIGVDNIADKPETLTKLFDLVNLCDGKSGGWGRLFDDTGILRDGSGYRIYLRDEKLSAVFRYITVMRGALTSYFTGRYRIELRVYGDPRLDPADAKYKVTVYADISDWQRIKDMGFLEPGGAVEAELAEY